MKPLHEQLAKIAPGIPWRAPARIDDASDALALMRSYEHATATTPAGTIGITYRHHEKEWPWLAVSVSAGGVRKEREASNLWTAAWVAISDISHIPRLAVKHPSPLPIFGWVTSQVGGDPLLLFFLAADLAWMFGPAIAYLACGAGALLAHHVAVAVWALGVSGWLVSVLVRRVKIRRAADARRRLIVADVMRYRLTAKAEQAHGGALSLAEQASGGGA